MAHALLGIAILLALAISLLAVPITVAFRIDGIEEVKGYLSFRWLFGVVRFRLPVPGDAKPERRSRRQNAKKATARKGSGGGRTVLVLLKQAVFRRRAVRFVKDLLGTVHGRDLYLRLRVGLDDPADTGWLWALLGPLAGIAANLRFADVRIEPAFTDPVLEVESRGEFRLVPLQVAALAIAFAASPTTLRAWRTARQGAGGGRTARR